MIRIDSIWLATEPLDMRAGTETALAKVIAVFGAAQPHCAYLFANRRANRMKVLVHDGFGIWLAGRRLNQGKFHWPGIRHGSEVGLVWLICKSHELAGAQQAANERGREHLQAFLDRLDQHYRQHWSIARYAEELGLSAPHLNALCRRLAGQSSLQMINQRLLLEAKRCLIYTHMTVNKISDTLGFSEPAYFSRFFKRGTGQSPKAFRVAR